MLTLPSTSLYFPSLSPSFSILISSLSFHSYSNPSQFPSLIILYYYKPSLYHSVCPSLLFHCIPASPPSGRIITLTTPFPFHNNSFPFPSQANKKAPDIIIWCLIFFFYCHRKVFPKNVLLGFVLPPDLFCWVHPIYLYSALKIFFQYLPLIFRAVPPSIFPYSAPYYLLLLIIVII